MERTRRQVWDASVCGVGWKMRVVREGGGCWMPRFLAQPLTVIVRIGEEQCIWGKIVQMW